MYFRGYCVLLLICDCTFLCTFLCTYICWLMCKFVLVLFTVCMHCRTGVFASVDAWACQGVVHGAYFNHGLCCWFALGCAA